MCKTYKIGTIIEAREDGSYIYMSNRGVVNLDNHKELWEEQELDEEYLSSHSTYACDRCV